MPYNHLNTAGVSAYYGREKNKNAKAAYYKRGRGDAAHED